MTERHVGGQIPDRPGSFVVAIGGEPPLGEGCPASGTSIVILAAAANRNHPRDLLTVAFALEREVVALECIAFGASGESLGHAVLVPTRQALQVLRRGSATTFQSITDEVARGWMAFDEGLESGE